MHVEPASHDDSRLLARWALEGSEEAFAEIVRNYQRLVLGAALRRTGDAELARDVAQQVFATLAAKARSLTGRPNLAGWLYQATSYIAARAAQAERQRRERQQNFGEPAAGEPHDTQWPLVEEALGALSATDRESLVLHYFQDLAYPEIAATLGIRETAARKRVSRALRSLEGQMRRRGLRGAIAGLLAGAAAQQGATSAQAGLASAALAASGSVSAPAMLSLTTLMSQTSCKIAACAAALTLTPLIFQWQANAGLREEIATQRRAHSEIAGGLEAASLRKKQAALEAEWAAKQAARIATEKRVAELAALKDTLDHEVVISLGTVESMAKKIAQMAAASAELEVTPKPAPGTEAAKILDKRVAEMAGTLTEAMAILRDIPKLERDPAKAGRFYATLMNELIGFDEKTAAVVETAATQWVAGLQQDGLALPQRPKGKATEWDARRDAATSRFLSGITPQLPPPAAGKPGLKELMNLVSEGNDGGYEFITTEATP